MMVSNLLTTLPDFLSDHVQKDLKVRVFGSNAGRDEACLVSTTLQGEQYSNTGKKTRKKWLGAQMAGRAKVCEPREPDRSTEALALLGLSE